MRLSVASSLLAIAVLVAPSSALACVAIAYDTRGVTAESMSRGMVADAASIEIMRVVSRVSIPADPLYASEFGTMYEYRLETTERLKGGTRGVMSITGLDPRWLQQRFPDWPQREEHGALWWLEPNGYAGLQELSVFNPRDFLTTTCAAPVTLQVGDSYLVFRGASGELLSPGLTAGQRRRIGRQRPVIERLHGPDDRWLDAVRQALQNQ